MYNHAATYVKSLPNSHLVKELVLTNRTMRSTTWNRERERKGRERGKGKGERRREEISNKYICGCYGYLEIQQFVSSG